MSFGLNSEAQIISSKINAGYSADKSFENQKPIYFFKKTIFMQSQRMWKLPSQHKPEK
jgi:hypothetical protein